MAAPDGCEVDNHHPAQTRIMGQEWSRRIRTDNNNHHNQTADRRLLPIATLPIFYLEVMQ